MSEAPNVGITSQQDKWRKPYITAEESAALDWLKAGRAVDRDKRRESEPMPEELAERQRRSDEAKVHPDKPAKWQGYSRETFK